MMEAFWDFWKEKWNEGGRLDKLAVIVILLSMALAVALVTFMVGILYWACWPIGVVFTFLAVLFWAVNQINR